MKNKNDRYLVPRKKYKEIKAYDHKQMEEFITIVFDEGVELGKKKAIESLAEERMRELEENKLDFEKISEGLLNIKGIGATKVNAILEVIKNCSNTIN